MNTFIYVANYVYLYLYKICVYEIKYIIKKIVFWLLTIYVIIIILEIIASYNDEDIYLFDSQETNSNKYLHRYRGHRNSHTGKYSTLSSMKYLLYC